MKILSLTAENVKRLVAVEIAPDGNVVQITGKNASGKTSVLDSIYWALCGKDAVQSTPIRAGQEEARITLDMGEIVVTRTFSVSDDNKFTTKLEVYSADGAKFPRPQDMLDQLIGSLSFDPLEFARKPQKEQVDALKVFVPEVDFEAIAAANAEDYDARRLANQQAKELKATAAAIDVPIVPDLDESLNEDELLQQITDAGKHNAQIVERQARRSAVSNEIIEAEKKIAALKKEIDTLVAANADRKAKLEAAPALPALVSVDELTADLAKARRVTAMREASAAKMDYLDRAAAAEKTAIELTDRMAARQEEVRAKIAEAQMPVPGLSLTDTDVLLNEVPFGQASHAEQLRASVAIAMAANPKLRVILVRDASLLDDDSMKIIADLAADKDYQIWVERVDGSGKVGFVLEDGHLKKGDDDGRETRVHDDSRGTVDAGSGVQPVPAHAPKRGRKGTGRSAGGDERSAAPGKPVVGSDWDGEGL